MKPFVITKRQTIHNLANNNSTNKNLHSFVDDSDQKVAERQQNALEIAINCIL